MTDLVAQRRAPGAGRTENLKVRLSRTERDALQERARARGVSVARLLVDAALGEPLPAARAEVEVTNRAMLDTAIEELKATRGALGRVANNINQLAHQANTVDDLPAAQRLGEALAEHRALTHQFMRLAVRLSRWSRGLPDAGGWKPDGEDDPDQGSEDWWARQCDKQRGSWAARREDGQE